MLQSKPFVVRKHPSKRIEGRIVCREGAVGIVCASKRSMPANCPVSVQFRDKRMEVRVQSVGQAGMRDLGVDGYNTTLDQGQGIR